MFRAYKKVIDRYVGATNNVEAMVKRGDELGVLKLISTTLRTVIYIIIVALFLIGAYITYKTPSKAVLPEGFVSIEPDAQVAHKLRTEALATSAVAVNTEGFDAGLGDTAAAAPDAAGSIDINRCPNILVQHGSDIFLYNSKVEKVPGVNPIRFKSLEDYSEFMDWLKGRGIRCPVLFLQYSYDAQGNPVYKMRPSPTDLQGGLSPNVPYSPAPAALVQMMDASRDNPPFNNQMYDGYDPLNFNIGDYTAQDAAFREKELTMKYSDNPMDSNWGGIRYSESVVDSGAYIERTRPDAARSDTSALVPMKVPQTNEKYRSARYTGDSVSRGRGEDVELGKVRR
jgi:hypothetical protein